MHSVRAQCELTLNSVLAHIASVVNSVLTSFQFILLSTEIEMNLLVVLLLILTSISRTCASMLLFHIFLLPSGYVSLGKSEIGFLIQDHMDSL